MVMKNVLCWENALGFKSKESVLSKKANEYFSLQSAVNGMTAFNTTHRLHTVGLYWDQDYLIQILTDSERIVYSIGLKKEKKLSLLFKQICLKCFSD